MGKLTKLRGLTRKVAVAALAIVMVAVGFVPAKAVAPLGNSTFLAQTQTQNLSGINGASTTSYNAQSVVLNGVVYYIANGPLTGAELYSTDGTAAGTNLVKDVYTGPNGYANYLTVSNGKLFFSENGNTGGFEPYVSDGTAAGTTLLKDIYPNNSSSSPTQFTQGPNGLTYFVANDGSTSLTAGSTNIDNGQELWVTDGTTAGTRKVKDVNTYSYYVSSSNSYSTSQSAISNLSSCNGKLFFAASDGNYNSYTEPYVSDGTSAGTTLLKDINTTTTTTTYPMYSQVLGLTIAAGATVSLGSYPTSFTCVNNTMYFTADDGTGTRKLYKSDGTTAGTAPVRAVASGSYPANPTSLFALGTKLIFSATANPYGPNSDNYGAELWITDGTDSGTVLLKDINPNSSSSSPTNFAAYNGQAYFAATDARGTELWKTDGTTVGTLFVKDINTSTTGASSTPQYFYVWNNKLYFTANDGYTGQELYVTQGTGVSTVQIKDVFPGISDMLDISNNSTNKPYFAAATNALVFVANSPIYGQEMWTTDGTNANTQLLQDLNTNPGSANAHDEIAFNGKIYFSAASAYYGQELWSTDLTSGNTQQVIDLYPGASSGMDATNSYLTIFNGRLYFAARNATSGYELFSTDGTAAGTTLVADLYASTNAILAPSSLTVCNGKLYFEEYGSGQYGTLYTLFTYDGTTTTQVFNNQLFTSGATSMACYNNQVYFSGQNYAGGTYDPEVWRSDGTRAGTALFYDAYPGMCATQGCYGSPANLTVANNKLYFTATNNTATTGTGIELYMTDGTTTSVIDINPGVGASSPTYLRVYNGVLWFRAYSPTSGTDMFSHDGTTLTPRDLVAGASSVTIDTNIVVAGGLIWYRGNSSAAGYELFSSDGTIANSGVFEDLSPGAASTTISALTAVGGVLMYNTYDSVMGSQPRFIVVSNTTNVTFDANGATGGAAPSTIAVMAASATVPGNTGAMVKTGYDFVGWNTSATGIGTTYLPGSTITPVVDTPLYAKWASQTAYTITYNANGATSGTVAPVLTGVTSMITLDNNSGAMAKSGGYVFGGWNTNAAGTGTNYLGGSRYTATSNITLYAKWTALASATITYVINGATGTVPSALVSYVTAQVTLPGQGSMIAPANKTFAGWNTNAAGTGSAYAAGEVYSPQGSISLYAQWTGTAASTLTYDSNGATTGSVPAAVSASGTYVVIDNNSGSLRKTGYIFTGWNTAADGSGTTYQGTDNFLLNANTTLYALWVAANYTVTFAGNGNTGGTVPAAITGISVSTTVPANTGTLVRAGYTFGGWNTLASGLGTTYLANSTFTPTSSTTLYALWTALPTYTITYNGNGYTGGGVPVAQSGIYSSVTLDNNSGNLVKSSFYFAGWNTQADGLGTTYAAGASFTPSANITLYALWSNVATYTLSYNANSSTSGTAPLPQTGVTSTATVSTNSGSLTRLGYRFDGWNTLANGTGTAYAVSSTITLTADTTLYAVWISVPTYTITYNGNGQTSGSVPSPITSSDASVPLAANTGVLNKTGYTFNGWNTLANGTGTHYDVAAGYPLTANVTLYAEWLANIYTLTYNANGSTAGTVPSPTSGRGTLTTALNSGSLVKDAYTFGGWNTAADGTGTQIAAGATYTPTANTTLFAKWTAIPTYTITFNANGATSGSVPAALANVYLAQTLPGNTGSLALAARAFGGWNTLANGTGTTYAAGASLTPSANITLYAIWNINYSITYDANGATSGSVPATQTGLSGTATVAQNTGALDRTAYSFSGWNTAANGTGTNYAVGASITSSVDVILYAKWTLIPTYTLSFSANGATSGTVPTAISGIVSSVTLPANTGNLARTGFVFSGWNILANGTGMNYDVNSSMSIGLDFTLYARWVAVYSITYYANGATSGSVPAAQTGITASATISGNTGSLDLPGSTFAGWNTLANGTGTSYAAGTSVTPTSDITLFAVWSLIPTYSVTYLANGATGGAVPTTQTGVLSSVTISGNTGSLVRTGYSFVGWNLQANGLGTSYSANTNITISANLTLYARWIAVFSISYNSNGATSGSAPAAQTGITGSATISSNTGSLALAGSNFSGWNTQANGLGTNYSAGASVTPTADLVLYAKWSLIPTFTITYDDNGSTGGSPLMAVSGVSSSVVLDNNSGALTKTGYVFGGWNTQANGLGTTYAGGASFNPGANVTLYVLWTIAPVVQQNTPPEPKVTVTAIAERKLDVSTSMTQTVTGKNLGNVSKVLLNGVELNITGKTSDSVSFTVTPQAPGMASLTLVADGTNVTFNNFMEFTAPKVVNLNNVLSTGVVGLNSPQIGLIAQEIQRAKGFKSVQLSFGQSKGPQARITLKDNMALMKLAMKLMQILPKTVDVALRLTGNVKDLVITFKNS